MSVQALNEVADNYFSSLNPIAERISNDIDAIREAYDDLWRCLSQHERDQIINETVIYPEAILKYALNSKSPTYDLTSLSFYYNSMKVTGAKYIVDENTGLSWRDEHSSPFSWKTPSQIDLSIFGCSKCHSENGADSDPNCDKNAKKNQIEFTASKSIWNNLWDNEQHDNKQGQKKEKSQAEKNGKKIIETPDSPNLVLGGTCSKISGLCSKLKFLPGKSFSYEVKAVVSCPSNNTPADVNILEKIKTSAVSKIQNTIKFVGGRSHGAADKKNSNEIDESENLVHSKEAITIVRLQKPSPRVSKPKSPPPPPPCIKLVPLQNEISDKASKKLTKFDKNNSINDSENTILLQDNSETSLPSVDQDSMTFMHDTQSKVVHDMSDEIKSISTECTPLSGPSFDNIPKSGFDFLDNW